MNLSKFKKVQESENHAVLQHPDGHQITIAKAAISPKLKNDLKALPTVQNFDDGGPVLNAPAYNPVDPMAQPLNADEQAKMDADTKSGPSAEDLDMRLKTQLGSLGGFLTGGAANASLREKLDRVTGYKAPEEDLPPQPSIQIGSTDRSPQVTGAQPPAPVVDSKSSEAKLAIPDATQTFLGGYNQAQQGIREQAQAEGDLGDRQAAQAYMQQQKLSDLNDEFKSQTDTKTEEINNVIKDIQNGRINPNHYQENISSGQRVANIIGIALGGTPALEFMNKQIERDINAQQANLDNKKTLLGAYQQQFGNLKDAMTMTRATLAAIYGTQLEQSAAESKSPIAMARAKQLNGELAMTHGPQFQDMNMKHALQQKMQSGANVDAIDLVNAGIIPKEYQADAYKEQQSFNAQKNAVQSARSLYGELNKEQTTGNLVNPQSYQRVKALKSQLVNAVMEASPSKRLTRESIEAEIDPLMTKTTSSNQTRGTQLGGLLKIIENHADATPLLEHYGLRSGNQTDFLSPQEKSIAREAQQRLKRDPSDKLGMTAMKKLGLQ